MDDVATNTPYPASLPAAGTDTPRPATDGALLQQFQDGDESAATTLFDRYVHRVHSLAESRCGRTYDARFDADDIVQTVFRSFFQGARQETYQAPEDGELWGLLLVLTLNKVRSYVDHHRAAKRNVHRTSRPDRTDAWPVFDEAGSTPGFLDSVIDDLMTGLPESNREIVRMRIQGHEVRAIAMRTGRSRRTVERVLQDFRERIAESDTIRRSP
jgi:RNA polymerase sigma-70 factor (ECF subfamily)